MSFRFPASALRTLLLCAGLWFASNAGVAGLAGSYVLQGPFGAGIEVGGTANTGSIDLAYGYGWSVAGGVLSPCGP